ncbi:malonic semialdehyde reductase [Sphingomonas mollis]|uniref:Malonic semialdehyde reductase n=1 Tax=Sphingomonas mollis TaxID=2795726 RepID=A0ABS0XKL9_9SPHN|nr:malonic semialdehyde reductase [Sphingomonas sp. BT553]MBJ6120581.1 malonic semialdehyde reductase [Sphingomonas sp. BT553]
MAAIDRNAIDQLFLNARSYNHYTDTPVAEADLHAIWELAKMGPTSANQLPARLVWCTSQDAKDKLAACASDTNADKIRKAPVAVIVAMDHEFHELLPELFPHTDAKSWFTGNAELRAASAFRNSTLQGAYLIMAARALGFDMGPMSGFDAGAVDKAFFSDRPAVKTNFISTLGHGDPSTLHERLPRPSFDRFNSIA